MTQKEVKKIRDSNMISDTIRDWWVGEINKPIIDYCIKNKVSPDVLTLTGVGINFLAALLFWQGWFFLGGFCIVIGSNFDLLDGIVARSLGVASKSGAFFDSVTDRYADAILFFGLAGYYRNSWVLLIVLAAVLGSFMVSYSKARSEALGVSCEVGLMQRPERILYLGLGSGFSGLISISLSPFFPEDYEVPQYLLLVILLILAIFTNITAIDRIRYSLNKLRNP
jgi:CDP-diacylglycerol--glycerol-3-phosphate 3-phosphatidyltransferase